MHNDGSLLEAIAAMHAAYETVVACSVDTPTLPELLSALSEWETLTRQMPTLSHGILARLQREASPVELGAKSLKAVLTTRLRISAAEAGRRLNEATVLGPRVGLSGEPMAPVLDTVAAAQDAGRIGAEHVTVIRTFFTKLPAWVDTVTTEQLQDTLVRIAVGHGPETLRKDADRLATLLDQDGPQPNDADRARKRFLKIGRQQPDGMSPISGLLDPHGRATFEAAHAKLAAPGMCNPDDDHPRTTGTPTQHQIDTDTRTPGQRTHDALTAIGRSVLSSGELGQHNGLPVTVIVSTTLQDLESAAGTAVTAGGTLLPMSDLIRMASHARHYLRIYDKHTAEELYLARTKRIAPPAHRIVLYARDRGCTKPGCIVPAHGTQVHHVNGWATNNGQTNIDEEVLACGPDNRLAETGWTVTVRHGIAEWTPPPHLDTGQTRTNHYHHPERLLADPDDGT
jgi:hypothetical protein